ncbi:MAG TPA: DUF4157 domain-containing protein [Nitrososphaera sp.]
MKHFIGPEIDFAKIGIQPKLKAGQPGDPYEQEADSIAEQVMRMIDTDPAAPMVNAAKKGEEIDRKCAACEENEEEEQEETTMTVGRKPSSAYNPEPDERVMNDIDNIRSSNGRSIDANTEGFMESRFGYDFSSVRIHTDEIAARSANSIHARAYTIGNHVIFGDGQYQPDTLEGRKLLAHELTHVIQQTGAGGKKINRSKVGFDLFPAGVHRMIQRDLAIRPPRPHATGRVLTQAQVADAIAFNERVLLSIGDSADIIEMIRDVIGIGALPAVIDEDFVNGVVQWQANFGLAQDGKLGPRTARPLFREIGAEGAGRGQVRRAPRYNPAGPINVPRAGARNAHFDMTAEFASDPKNGIFPSCCEVRQDIQWDAAFVAASVANGHGAVPHAGFPAAHPAGRWIEDRDQRGGRYGHRSGPFSDPGAFDHYLDSRGRQNQAFGHRFEGNDTPTGLATDRGSWSFRLRVIDVCNGNRQLAVSPTLVVNWP